MKMSVGEVKSYDDLDLGDIFLALIVDETDNHTVTTCLKIEGEQFVAFQKTGPIMFMSGHVAAPHNIIHLDRAELATADIRNVSVIESLETGDILYRKEGLYLVLQDNAALRLHDLKQVRLAPLTRNLALRSWQIVWDSWERPLFRWPPES